MKIEAQFFNPQSVKSCSKKIRNFQLPKPIIVKHDGFKEYIRKITPHTKIHIRSTLLLY